MITDKMIIKSLLGKRQMQHNLSKNINKKTILTYFLINTTVNDWKDTGPVI